MPDRRTFRLPTGPRFPSCIPCIVAAAPRNVGGSRAKRSVAEKRLLAVEGLGIFRDDTLILDGVDWVIRPGEHWAVLGPNGSGKTSLLSALLGYFPPSSGSIRLLGREYGRADWRQLRRRIGLVSSSLRQRIPELETGFEIVVSGKDAQIDYWGTPSASERRQANQWLAAVDCAYLADRPWSYLSQGERQRVLIARALMARPVVLILDEPCAGLDPVAREHFLQFLERMARRKGGPALVLVTHHVEELVDGFSHALVLSAGRVVAAGPMATALTSPLLSKAFGTGVRLHRRDGRFGLTLRASRSSRVL